MEKVKLRDTVDQTYGEYYVLITNIGSAYKWFIFHLEVVMVTTMIVCLSACTRIPDQVVAARLGVLGFVGTAVFLSLFSSLADVHEQFEGMTSSWRQLPLQDAWMKKFLRSAKPLGIRVGSYFEAFFSYVLILSMADVERPFESFMSLHCELQPATSSTFIITR